MSDGSLFVLRRVSMAQNNALICEELKLQLENALKDVVEGFDGVELVEIKFFKEYGKLNMSVFIWKKEGISLDDCELVHNAVSAELDKYEDKFDADYVLNVSSQGLDRKIVSADDFRRALDTEIEVFSGKNQSCHGILTRFDEECITITTTGKKPTEITILRINTTKVQPYIRF